MKRIEEMLGDFIFAKVGLVLEKIINPDITIDKVTDLDEEQIEFIKKYYGIKGIILDVDDTLRTNLNDIPPINQEWINQLSKQLKIIVVSNGLDRNVEKYFNEIGITYIPIAFKPLKRGFKKACEELELRPEEILVVGNSLFDDIYGGKRMNMKTALVKDVEEVR